MVKKPQSLMLLRQGHSLVELVAATACSAILLAGLGSVMLIARQIAYTPTASTAQLEAAAVVNQLANELRFATMITQYVNGADEQLLEFVVADRNNDSRAERIRYDWPLHPDVGQRVPGAPPHVFKTIVDSGGDTATWALIETAEADGNAVPPFQVQLIESSPPQTVAQYTNARVQLQTAAANHSRVDSAIPLLARPERLVACWRTDFDPGVNPTTFDMDGSGFVDWVSSGGATFVGAVLSNGAWSANGSLATNPFNSFATTTIVEACCKNQAPSGAVDVLQINADRQTSQSGGSYAPLTVRMQRQLDGTQSLMLRGPQGGQIVTLKQVDNLADDYVRFRLIVYPSTNQVSLHVNEAGDDVLGGPFGYTPIMPLPADRCVRLFAGPKFDYVDVRVGAN